ncbi:MAG TPA: NADH-quinone oxidoreductase subunit NuoH [Deltaproteobacteria bacterium]|nr:MAG: NADH-quinone oxidoreductase subunit H [Deltaproteobacteria bacterium GWA2_55_82]OGQ64181.1 MAG: NADH-quinone oxidoreductase subunit H [Deltaproteobacteria bacterium RIFCSPLOWO2_02_FULL_55_12]OIJ74635.1 MAG: NADH-quinone oxidoreductase subunit H [Deltaproteobacteria bacterium GWC2_55_46]HBG46419.1 NADH-quinone oxidoreductase subunit NuoH [Deltaproteobacteria bacterium]HCY10631.1 NADH-quinone oxidoreductase subunit NuoH [Deltaproteobacteria bacterium]
MPDTGTLIEVLIIIVKVWAVTAILFSLPMPLTWMERKVAGHIHVRLGPMRVGPHGILQPLADTLKLILKEDIVPEKADRFLFKLAPLIAMVPAFLVFVAIPFGDKVTIPFIDKELTLYLSDMNVGILYILAIGGLGIYGVIFGGWASNSKYALLGGLRSSAQMISYEISLSFAAIGVVMMSDSLNLLDMVRSQAGGIFHWNILYLPIGPVWFVIFLIAALAEMNRIPFDLPEDEGTLASGFHTEYSGMRFSYFMLAEYIALVTVSVLTVIMFFGGWNPPIDHPLFNMVPALFWFIGKVVFFIYFFMWLRFTLPRYRYDQLMTIGWKVLIPLSLVSVLITGLMKI